MSPSVSFEEVRAQSEALGYDDVGITDASIPLEDCEAYRKWVSLGYHASLTYMENTLRCSPQELFPGAKSAIIFVSYYKQEPVPFQEGGGVIASYARGRDYHNVHRGRLKRFIRWLEERVGERGVAKGFSDSTPILEKALAVQAGLGWFGKNTLLIHRRFGTFTLLSGVLTTLTLPHTPKPTLQHAMRCGSCDRCLKACPVGALDTPYQLDANKCLSYHLIESKEPVPPSIQQKNPGYLFGCDICQDVCPHNARKAPSSSADFLPERGLGAFLSFAETEALIQHPETLNGTPLKRKGSQGLYQTSQSLINRGGI